MTDPQFKYIWTTMVAANSSWSLGAKAPSTVELYYKQLKKFDRAIFNIVVTRLIEFSEDKYLPDVGVFIRMCRKVQDENIAAKTPQIKPCPCCNNDRWVMVMRGTNEYSTLCDCVDRSYAEEFLIKPNGDGSSKNPRFLKAYDWFMDNRKSKCSAMSCHPHKTTPCPYGMQHYNRKKAEFMARMQKDEAFQAGLTHSKHYKKFSKLIEETADSISDISGEEDKLSF